jgi:hypothetical protein
VREFGARITVFLMAAAAIVLPPNFGLSQAAAQVQSAQPMAKADKPVAAKPNGDACDRGPENPEGALGSCAGENFAPNDQTDTGAVAANWYVDSVHGNDANSGRDIDHPFKTIGRLLASNITPRQTIALKAGSHWRETLTVPAADILVTSYGKGQKPLLDASDVVIHTLWGKVPGTKNVYQVSVPIDADPNITWVNAWEDGKFLVRATSIANCDATPGSYYPSADTGNGTIPITLYIHTGNGSNPATNGKLYEYSKRQNAFVSVDPKVTVLGLWTRRNLNNNGSFALTGMGSLAVDILITDGGKHNAYISPGVSMTDVTLENQYYAGNDFIMVVINANGMAGDSTFTRVHAYSTVSTGAVGAGIGSHSNDDKAFTGTFTCVDCEVDNMGGGFALGGWNNVVLTRPITSGTSAGVGVIGRVKTTITGGKIVALNGRGITNGDPLTYNSNVVIRSTAVTSNGDNAILLSGTSITITSSTISTEDGIHGPIYLTADNKFELTRNTVNRGTESSQPFYLLPPDATGVSDYNTFLSDATSGTPFWKAGQWSFAQWRGLGYDLHSTTP